MKNTYIKFKEDFTKLLKDDKLNINSLEKLILDNYNDYKRQIQKLSIDLLKEKIDENFLIVK